MIAHQPHRVGEHSITATAIDTPPQKATADLAVGETNPPIRFLYTCEDCGMSSLDYLYFQDLRECQGSKEQVNLGID